MSKVRTNQLQQMGAVVGKALVWTADGWLPGDYDDTSKIPKSLVDAKGDLITATADNVPARIGVGTDGQLLSADSSQATGLRWITPPPTLTVQDEGVSLAVRPLLDFVGAGITATDDSANGRTIVTVPNSRPTDYVQGWTGSLPYYIPSTDVWTVPVNDTAVLASPSTVDGMLVVNGLVVEVKV